MRWRISREAGKGVRGVLPTIVLVALALGVFALDPVRRAPAAIEPGSLVVGPELPQGSAWLGRESIQDQPAQDLPRAYPPHKSYADVVFGFEASEGGLDGEAFLRVVVVEDRHDLLAFEPRYAMRAGGWDMVASGASDGMWRTEHTQGSGLLRERLVVETVYVVPGRWDARRAIAAEAGTLGPGWPGPGALVQIVATLPLGADLEPLRAQAQAIAEELSASLAGDEQP